MILLKSLAKTFIGWGQLRSQPFFERLSCFAATGMNYGNWDHERNGEVFAMNYICDRLALHGRRAMIFDVAPTPGDIPCRS